MPPQAALYARVSTAAQAQDHTIASQVSRLEVLAATLGVTIPPDRRYLDEGISGTRLARPALDALRDAVADGLLNLVLVLSPDRLARNYVHQQLLLEELKKHGAEVRFVDRPVSEQPEEKLLVQMQGMFAEYERAKILERTRRGRLHKVRQGEVLPFSQAPYGYKLLRTPGQRRPQVVIEETQAEHVREMYRWIVEESLSCRQVTRRLNERGIKPPRAERWVSSAVHKMLRNPLYTGQAVFNRREAVEPRRPKHPGQYRKLLKSSTRLRPESQWLKVPVPALISVATQEEVRVRFAQNRWQARRHTEHEYLLRTLVVCGQCRLRMACYCEHRPTRPARLFYACLKKPIETGRLTKCPCRPLRAEELDRVVWEAVCGWLQEPQMLATELAVWQEGQAQAAQAEQERSRWEQRARQLAEQRRRLLDAYQEGAVTLEELRPRRAEVERHEQECRERLNHLEEQRHARHRFDEWGAGMEQFAATVRHGLAALDFEGRQKLMRFLVERVVVTGEDVRIEHAVPLSGRYAELRPPRHGAGGPWPAE